MASFINGVPRNTPTDGEEGYPCDDLLEALDAEIAALDAEIAKLHQRRDELTRWRKARRESSVQNNFTNLF